MIPLHLLEIHIEAKHHRAVHGVSQAIIGAQLGIPEFERGEAEEIVPADKHAATLDVQFFKPCLGPTKATWHSYFASAGTTPTKSKVSPSSQRKTTGCE